MYIVNMMMHSTDVAPAHEGRTVATPLGMVDCHTGIHVSTSLDATINVHPHVPTLTLTAQAVHTQKGLAYGMNEAMQACFTQALTMLSDALQDGDNMRVTLALDNLAHTNMIDLAQRIDLENRLKGAY